MRILLICMLAWPINTSAQVCDVLVDMAIVARAMAEERIEKDSIVGVLTRIYNAPDLSETMAAMAVADRRSTAQFAMVIRSQCEKHAPKLSPA